MALILKDTSRMAQKSQESLYGRTKMYTTDSLWIINFQERENLHGRIRNHMKAHGRKI